jgi:RHS repeat-associated protein
LLRPELAEKKNPASSCLRKGWGTLGIVRTKGGPPGPPSQLPVTVNFSGGQNASNIPDTGTVTATIAGTAYQVSYGANDSSSSIAGNLAAAISAGSLANASVAGSTVNVTSKPAGSGHDYSLAVGYTWNTSQFNGPSFTISSSGSALTGGYNVGDPANSPFVTQYAYNGLGDLLTVTQKGDPTVTASSQWRVRNFTYDTLRRLLTAQNPESGAISYSYDADGNLLQKTSPAPNALPPSTATQTISYCYDELNRITGRAYSAQSCPLSSPPVSYVYDLGANAKGKLTSFTDQAGSGSYTYDILGRMAGETRVINPGAPLGAVTKNMSYAYNLDGSLKTLTYPSGASVTYTPDSAGRMLSAVDTGSGINYATGATYGPDSGLTGFVSGSTGGFAGIANAFSYNKRLQPINMSATAPNQTVFSIGYDFHVGNGTTGSDNGNVFGITNYKDNTRNQSFTYDGLNRLTSAQNAGTNCNTMTLNGKTEYWGNTYGYDAWGNLLQKTVTKCNAENLSVGVLANNQLTGYGYDVAGNMTSDPTDLVTSTYDPENRIAAATKNGVSTTYTYDDDGNRVEKTSGGTGTLYWYMAPGIVAESDLAGNLQSEYVFFDGERMARKDFPGLAVSYYFSDHLKTTDIVTDALGNIKNESDFYPWGGELQFANSDSNHYTFTGKEDDKETGFYYFGARYYSNGMGRFITPDWSATPVPVPYADLDDPQSLNQYSYVRNIPTVKVDPDGHWPAVLDKVVAKAETYAEKGLEKLVNSAEGALEDVVEGAEITGEAAVEGAEIAGVTATDLIAGGAGLVLASSTRLNDDPKEREFAYRMEHPQRGQTQSNGQTQETEEAAKPQVSTSGAGKKGGGPKADDAAGVTAGGQATDKHGNKLTGSGQVQVNITRSNTREKAGNKALNQGSGKVEHRSPRVGNRHFHPTNNKGKQKPGSTHHEF